MKEFTKEKRIPWNKGKRGLQVSWNKGTKGVMRAWNKNKKGWTKGTKAGFQKGNTYHLGNIGGKQSNETRKKISGSHKGKHQSEETKRRISEARIANPIRSSKSKDTGIELKIEAELIKRGISYQKQVPLCKIAIVDFYLPEYSIVIQADGCYWHNCPIHGKGFVSRGCNSYKKQDPVLTFNGLNVYRFWEHEINESVEECINKLGLIINN
jgi:DNA mismatch endonuclease (patch repair protein)